jgi:endogenous inhibitor of DNA gyrase (YacG/DUF329 family)
VTARIVACPQCSTRVEWSDANPNRPFCSERCRLLDLGAWASERYRVPAQPDPSADDEPLPPTDPGERS